VDDAALHQASVGDPRHLPGKIRSAVGQQAYVPRRSRVAARLAINVT
jgi:hypothetical protein